MGNYWLLMNAEQRGVIGFSDVATSKWPMLQGIAPHTCAYRRPSLNSVGHKTTAKKKTEKQRGIWREERVELTEMQGEKVRVG